MIFKLVHKIEEKECSFYEASITLIPKLDKDTTKKKYIDQFSRWTSTQILNKILANWIQQHI
jgi:hypothetical protein